MTCHCPHDLTFPWQPYFDRHFFQNSISTYFQIERKPSCCIFTSTKETLPNLVLGVLCACELPVPAIVEEIEILDLLGLSVPILAILKCHNNIQHAQHWHCFQRTRLCPALDQSFS